MASFSIPLSGLTAAQEQLQSISNNLSNLNTTGYKDQNVNFSDLFAQATMTNGAGDPLQIGSGVATASTTSDFTDGAQSATGIASNMELTGNGFFVTQSATGQDSFTRAGDFTVNNSGEIVAPDGSLVLGYPAVGGVVDTSAALQPIQVGNANSPAVATTSLQVTANLDSDTAVGSSGGASTLSVYDSLGQAHTLSIQYTNAGNNSWNYSVTIPSADLSSGGTGATQIASGSLSFNSSGQLELQGTPPATSININIPSGAGTSLADGAAPMSLNWNLTDGSGNPLITQTASASTTSATSQNGYASGTLSSYTVQPDGTVQGTFSSGATLALGQVAVATFANQQGLASNGNSEYQATVASGGAVMGVAGAGGRGSIVGGSVESSNVDISTEFAKMIVAQQAYSANAKAITTFNQVSQTTISMIQ
ncbi:flagellar hook-basal body complex protein [Granulicella sp. 5B5]|uniref:flagellar hook protein FlgE n=1 Tax=Granulicella sp. 5B5 TaxID=1617967 RepID=UPI0015F54E31|nr:flagellar hook protein FlgE [Granulicella sp. 5B5]QMV17521.1 flagellar hook-basal body complex protein [Granulicella sp. 5B5]